MSEQEEPTPEQQEKMLNEMKRAGAEIVITQMRDAAASKWRGACVYGALAVLCTHGNLMAIKYGFVLVASFALGQGAHLIFRARRIRRHVG